MKTSLFQYHLPVELIAQRPLVRRDGARMLVLDRKTGRITHSWVKELPQWLLANDLIVVNQTKVLPARMFAEKVETGAKLEIFLLRPAVGEDPNEWEVLISPAKRITGNLVLKIHPRGEAAVLESLEDGHFLVRFNKTGALKRFFQEVGHVPLPPYIKRSDDQRDEKRYQTIFAKKEGSVAAPTAGLHFTKAILANLKKRGVKNTSVILHVGLGTFLPVSTPDTEDHIMHSERLEVSPSAVKAIAKTRRDGGRVVAVGTTVVRALESSIGDDGKLRPNQDETRLFVTPGYSFKAVDTLFTNFHQSESTLLMLVCAFAGKERVLAAYQEAIKEKYRFFSYGDAMLIL